MLYSFLLTCPRAWLQQGWEGFKYQHIPTLKIYSVPFAALPLASLCRFHRLIFLYNVLLHFGTAMYSIYTQYVVLLMCMHKYVIYVNHIQICVINLDQCCYYYLGQNSQTLCFVFSINFLQHARSVNTSLLFLSDSELDKSFTVSVVKSWIHLLQTVMSPTKKHAALQCCFHSNNGSAV